MRARVLFALVLVLATLAPAAAAQDVEISQEILVEVQPDLSEEVVWELHAEGGYTSALALPPGIDVTSVRDEDGTRIRYDTDEDADGTTLTVEGMHFDIIVRFTRPAAVVDTAPLHSGVVSVAQYLEVENDIRVTVRVPEGHRLFWMSGGTVTATGVSASARSDESVHVRYAYSAPLPEGIALVEEGVFRMYAPPEEEDALREAARIATNATREAAELADLPVPPQGVHVVFLGEEAFAESEAGHYSEGIVSIRGSYLGAERIGNPWRLAAVLAHEAFHAVSVTDGAIDNGNTWWIEGGARFAERFVGGIEPWREPNCDACPLILNTQLTRDELVGLYEKPPARPPWEREPGAQTLDDVGYAYGGFLVASYIGQHGIEAYRDAWRQFRAAAARDSCTCDDLQLTRLLVTASGGAADRESIHEPFRALFESDRAAFDVAITGLVAEGEPLGEPVPLRFVDDDLVFVPLSPGIGWRPEVALDAAPQQERVEGAFTVGVAWWNATLASVPTGDSRPVVTIAFELDGEPARPELDADGSIGIARFPNATLGTHTVTARLVGPGGTTYGQAAEANATLELTARADLTLRSPAPGTQPPFLVGVAARAADLGEPLAGARVRLLVGGVELEERATDADGLAYFTLLEAPTGARVSVASGAEEIVVLDRVLPPSPTPPVATPSPAPTPIEAPSGPTHDGSPASPTPSPPAVPLPGWVPVLAAAGLALALRRR